MTQRISVLIAGPILSRVSESEALRVINSYWAIPGCSQVVLSTYSGETTPSIREAASTVLENIDPGPDCFGAVNNPIKSNLSRLLKTSCAGLSILSEGVAIKTRIEFSVSEPQKLHKAIQNSTSDLGGLNQLSIISEHMYPTGFRTKNPLFWCPDTFQFGVTAEMKATWIFASAWWHENGGILRNQKFTVFKPVQIANEQVIGIGLTRLLNGESSSKNISVRHRFSFNFSDAVQSIRMQYRMLKLYRFDSLGIQVSEGRLLTSQSRTSWQKRFDTFQTKSSIEMNHTIMFRVLSSGILSLFSWSQKAIYFSAVWIKHRKYP